MALTNQQKAQINSMCPAAKAVGLGDRIQDMETGILPEGSVGTAELADSAVTAAKLAANAVEEAKIKDGAVASAKLAAALQALVLGAASGYKLARGETSVTGTADVTTGLATVVAVVASLGEDAALTGLWVTAAIGGTAGHIDLKVWKPTAAADCTPIAATVAKKVDWIAIGT